MMNKTVGQRLREAREALGLSLDEAARETHIRLNYLQELESDHPEQLHSAAQARGFLRLYADYLNLPFDELSNAMQRENDEAEAKVEQSPSVMDKLPFKPKWLKKESSEKQKPDQIEAPEAQDDSAIAEPADTDQSQQAVIPQPASEVEVEKAQDEQQATDLAEDLAVEPQGEVSEVPPEIPEVESAEEETTVSPEQTDSESEEIVQEEKSHFSQRLVNLLARVPFLKKILRLQGEPTSAAEMEMKTGKKSKQPAKTSADIFNEIGKLMRSRRKMMELSLSDIENFTNLKRAFLVSIEEGRFSELPSTVQGRGMLNNYAQFLGMEETQVLDLYGQALQLQREERMKPQRRSVKAPVTVKVNVPERWRKILNPDLLIGGVLIIGLFIFIIWGATQVFSAAANEPTEAPSISEVLQITATIPSTEVVEVEETGTVEATPIPGVVVVEPTATIVATVNAAPLQLYILTHDRAYLNVDVDGAEAFAGRVLPNNVYTYSGNEIIHLLTGNAAALEVYFNQEYLGNLGGVGEVVDVDFTLEGLETPSPQPTSTITPELGLGDDAAAMEESLLATATETMTPEGEPESLPDDGTGEMMAE